MDFLFTAFFYILPAYLIGSIPTGYIIGKIAGLGDVRNVGSGNIGATNVVRAGGKKLGALTLVCDGLKSVLVVGFFMQNPVVGCNCEHYFSDITLAYLLGIITIIGHCFPIWLKFKGGKGVATGLGLIIIIHTFVALDSWWIIPTLAALWMISFKLTSIVSIASLLTFIVLPLLTFITNDIWVAPLCVSAIIIIRHKENIMRLIKGEEHGFSK